MWGVLNDRGMPLLAIAADCAGGAFEKERLRHYLGTDVLPPVAEAETLSAWLERHDDTH